MGGERLLNDLDPARGIITAVALSLPVWVLVAGLVWWMA
jgi:hypothetical protein